MKVVTLIALVVLGACKPDPAAKPAEGSAAAPQALRPHGPRPTLPADHAGSEPESAPEHHSRFDKDGDGVVSPEEREQAKAERAKRMFDRFDANHDGKLTPEELAASGSNHRGPHFDDPAALDTNHDGEISSDELQQGMRDLRQQRRARQMEMDGAGSGE